MKVREFVVNTAGKMAESVRSGEPLHIMYRSKPYATVVPTDLWERAKAALDEQEKRGTAA